MANEQISSEIINDFLSGKDPMLGIIAIECGYQDENVTIISKDIVTGEKRISTEGFRPFVWAKQSGARKLFIDYKTKKQDSTLLKKKMIQYGIEAKGLNIYSDDGQTTDRLEQGYRVMFRATKKMSYSKFMRFFKEGDVDLYGKEKEFLAVTPVEQHMMRTGKRMFKGFEDYNELTRLEFDLETQGLDPATDSIDQIGIRTNKGFEHIIPVEGSTKEELEESELDAIQLFFSIISEINPDVITGHNSENFDWPFIIKRLEVLGYNIKDVSGKYFKQAIYKKAKPTVLKLGGEMEFFNQTILWGCNITDSLHAVRRAQAIDSNMKEANLKYVTKYSKLNKPNRIYVPGDKIKTTYHDLEHSYALNNTDGTWYQINEKSALKEGYDSVTGRYIVERYLLDDLDETDKVELRYNQANFLIGKILPSSLTKVCTMGTAGIWKLIMMAWSYENNLAIPDFAPPRAFTGGLSRLLQVGYIDRVVKLDFNSLYPAITLTWDIKPSLDVSNVMMAMLGYVLEQRELYKDLKGVAGGNTKKAKKELENLTKGSFEYEEKLKEIKKWDAEANSNDNKQLPLKTLANSFFGSFGSAVFPWSEIQSAEKITCIGRQSLRLMTHWFGERGYKAIVGDSFLYDTPIYIKYKDSGIIDIKTIKEVFDSSKCEIDLLGREYDNSEKPYQVLCRTGWVDVTYVYRHKTDKDIHRVSFEDGLIDVTSDHSLFNEKQEKLHSKNVIVNETKLEMATIDFNSFIETKNNLTNEEIINMGIYLGLSGNKEKRIPTVIINSSLENQKLFIKSFMLNNKTNNKNNKVLNAGINFLVNRVK